MSTERDRGREMEREREGERDACERSAGEDAVGVFVEARKALGMSAHH